jgi:hypothetical protein
MSSKNLEIPPEVTEYVRQAIAHKVRASVKTNDAISRAISHLSRYFNMAAKELDVNDDARLIVLTALSDAKNVILRELKDPDDMKLLMDGLQTVTDTGVADHMKHMIDDWIRDMTDLM